MRNVLEIKVYVQSDKMVVPKYNGCLWAMQVATCEYDLCCYQQFFTFIQCNIQMSCIEMCT
jgi:hypothetical protein